eukprot:gene8476-12603_t
MPTGIPGLLYDVAAAPGNAAVIRVAAHRLSPTDIDAPAPLMGECPLPPFAPGQQGDAPLLAALRRGDDDAAIALLSLKKGRGGGGCRRGRGRGDATAACSCIGRRKGCDCSNDRLRKWGACYRRRPAGRIAWATAEGACGGDVLRSRWLNDTRPIDPLVASVRDDGRMLRTAGGGSAALRGAARGACRTLCEEEERCAGVTVDFAPAPGAGAGGDFGIDEGWADLGGGECVDANGEHMSRFMVYLGSDSEPMYLESRGTRAGLAPRRVVRDTMRRCRELCHANPPCAAYDIRILHDEGWITCYMYAPEWPRAPPAPPLLRCPGGAANCSSYRTGFLTYGGSPPAAYGQGNMVNLEKFAWTSACAGRAPRCVLHSAGGGSHPPPPPPVDGGTAAGAAGAGGGAPSAAECWRGASFAVEGGVGAGRCAGRARQPTLQGGW